MVVLCCARVRLLRCAAEGSTGRGGCAVLRWAQPSRRHGLEVVSARMVSCPSKTWTVCPTAGRMRS